MKKITGVILLLLLVVVAARAQNPFEFKGKFFGYFGAGYRTPLKKYFKGELLDDMISLKNSSVSIDVTHYYFIKNNWGVFFNLQFDPSRIKDRPESDLLRFARYENDYYFDNNGERRGASNTDYRMTIGGAYRIEKNRWRIFTSLGFGMTEFEGVDDYKNLKEKNSNIEYDAWLLWPKSSSDPDWKANFLITTSFLCGYRLNKRFTAVLNLRLARFSTDFEYRLERTNLFTKEKFIDDTYNYKRSTVDLTASAGIMFSQSIDRRNRFKK